MSLLWPKSLHVGLFPGHIWLQNRRINVEHPFTIDPLRIEQQILDVLAELFHAHQDQIDSKSKVIFSVSDRFAAIVQLPWKEQLFRQEEVRNFAQICFEKQHQVIDKDWLMHAEFARYGSAGLAYAFRQEWLGQLQALCEQQQLILERIMPMTARVYFGNQPSVRSGKQLIVMSEPSRISSIVLNGREMVGLDVEPVSQSFESSVVRLVKRTYALHEDSRQINCWAVDNDSQKRTWTAIKQALPELTIQTLNRQFQIVPHQ